MMQPAILGDLSPDRVPVVIRDAYTISYERGLECIFVHVDVRRWTPTVRRTFLADADTAQALLGEPVYALHETSEPLQPKFLKQAGFVVCGSVIEERTQQVIPIYCRPYAGKPILIFNL